MRGALPPAGDHREHRVRGLGPVALCIVSGTLAAMFYVLLTVKFSHPVSSPLSFGKLMLVLPLGEYVSIIHRKL